mgnify:CR=1 FL=1
MDLEQCYKELEGDYAEVMRRLRKEGLVHRFLIKFLESDEVQRIDEALQKRDYEKAFDLVHTLKGETMTLGFKMDYQKTIDIIRKYRDSQP